MKNYIKPSLILVVLIVLGTFVFVGAQQNQNNFNGSSGTGSGTVSANNGSAGAIANYASGGGSTTVGPDTLLTDSGTLLTYSGSAGISAKVVTMPGATSGTATITPPAVAGTTTNPFAFSNVQQGPSGAVATPTYGFTTANHGMWYDSANLGPAFSCGSASLTCAELSGGGGFISYYLASNFAFGISSSTSASSAGPDTRLSRSAAGVWSVDSGTTGNEAGLLRPGNTCRITADVSLTVNVANSFCSYSLPAVAKAWAFSCNIQWAITAGSGTNNFALGVNPSQTPTGATNGEAQIYTAAPANTSTMGSAAISASGATTILTGATYTPAATVQFANISGTLLASGTAGTFAIQATANGTTATAAVKAGSSCQLF